MLQIVDTDLEFCWRKRDGRLTVFATILTSSKLDGGKLPFALGFCRLRKAWIFPSSGVLARFPWVCGREVDILFGVRRPKMACPGHEPSISLVRCLNLLEKEKTRATRKRVSFSHPEKFSYPVMAR
ncbi:hypothetical protein QQ045_024194 [Rhodiola kirilowii]